LKPANASSTLGALQSALTDLYDLPATPDVAQFLMTDPRRLAAFADARATDEQLLIAEDEQGLAVSLFIAAPVLERLRRSDPFAELTHDNLADYLTAAEGVSHFVYLAWNAGHDKPVTLLELELQAEVDKYVLGARLLQQQGGGRVPHELHRALFERTRIDPEAAADRFGLYRTASNYAARFCRRVASRMERRARGTAGELLAELRRFYRLGGARKLAHIERWA
jgi:hypothetical protein